MAKLARPKSLEDRRHSPPPTILALLGEIAIIAAGIEDLLHAIYWKHAKLSDAAGAVVTVDARPNRLMEDIVKIARATGVQSEVVEDLTDIFLDYRPLATLRNKLLHWLWYPSKGEAQILEPPSYKLGVPSLRITYADIVELSSSLLWVEIRLAAHAMPPDQLLKERRELRSEADTYAPAPWLTEGR